ncbi:MAG: toll/interleukin-1 receptor domain-containing protein [Candidatus Competibacteraceae bacterium]|nr:toll/interleukin-1 receptor domain-containing protein [Candidatus Competibacteraceae bacterium]
MDTPHRIFVSYPRKRQNLAQRLVDELTTNGFIVWWDRQLTAGDDWQAAIQAAMAEADTLIALVDQQAASRWQQTEWELLLQNHWNDPSKRIIPVLLGRTKVPGFLSEFQGIRIEHRKDWPKAVAELIRGIRGESLSDSPLLAFSREEYRELRRQRLEYIGEVARQMKVQ